MAMRSTLNRLTVTRWMDSTRGSTRYFSEGKGRILSEEERAAENVYIQKMERERLEKQKLKAEKEKAEKEKEGAEKSMRCLLSGIERKSDEFETILARLSQAEMVVLGSVKGSVYGPGFEQKPEGAHKG